MDSRIQRSSFLYIIGIVLLLCWPCLKTIPADPDLFWHLQAGEEILQSGHVPTTDSYSFTFRGKPWINHEWLADVLLASAFRLAGDRGILILRNLILLTILILLGIWIHRLQGNGLWTTGSLFLSLIVLHPLINARPGIYTALLLLLVLALQEALHSGFGYAAWLSFPLLIFWTNVHGGFVMGCCLVLFIAAETLWSSSDTTRWKLVYPMVAAALLTPWINPFGGELIGYVIHEMGAPHLHVAEWLPPQGMQWLIVWTAGGLPWLLWKIGGERPGLTQGLLLVILTLMTVRSVRFILLQTIVSLLLTARVVGGFHPVRFHPRPGNPGGNRILRGTLPVLLLAASLGLVRDFSLTPLERAASGYVRVAGDAYPVEAVRFLRSTLSPGKSIRLMTGLNWSGFCIYHLYPRARVAFDGRNTTVFPPDFVDQYLNWYITGNVSEMQRQLAGELLLVETGGKMARNAAQAPGWKLIYQDPVACVFSCGSSAADSVVRGGTPRQWYRFPGAQDD